MDGKTFVIHFPVGCNINTLYVLHIILHVACNLFRSRFFPVKTSQEHLNYVNISPLHTNYRHFYRREAILTKRFYYYELKRTRNNIYSHTIYGYVV